MTAGGVSSFRCLVSEIRSACRGVRWRGWRAPLSVVLLGVALAGSTVVFSAADAFVFERVPYANADRLVVLQRTTRFDAASDYLLPGILREWRKHTDLFSSVHAHDVAASFYLTLGGITEAVRTQEVTPGLFEALGVAPRWGRTLQPGDEQPERARVAVISEELARRAFGDPAVAVGQLLRSADESIEIVGVMPVAFRFPTSRERIWRPLDLARQPANVGVRGLFVMAPGVQFETVGRAVAERTPVVARAATRPWGKEPVLAARLGAAQEHARARLVFGTLMAAAFALLLIACANVASLELAGAIARGRVYAIHAALGATRAALVRTSMIEGALLILASGVVAWVLSGWAVGILTASLPPSMSAPLVNPIDLDARAFGFTALAAAITWVATALPVAFRATSSNALDLLKRDDRTSGSRGFALRQGLMVGQVALTVMLLVAAALAVRTYGARVALEKGFDSSGLASIQVVEPSRDPARAAALRKDILSRVKGQPGVAAASTAGSIPPSASSGVSSRLSVEGRPSTDEWIVLSNYDVDPDYFATMGIRILAGRVFTDADPPGFLVVDEVFARRYWPAGDALGARFRMGGTGFGGASEFQIIGIASQVRMESAVTPGGVDLFIVYNRLPPSYSPLSFIVRLEHESQLGALASLVRDVAPRTIVRTDLVEARYRRLYGDVQLAASVTAGFGALAFIVAIAGIYGLMAFLVTSRIREIGVRVALGAQPSDIGQIFVGTALRLVLAGALLGLAGARAMSRAMQSMLFGVTPSDPMTYGLVLLGVSATALAATWPTVRHASRIDPAIVLRAE